MKQLLATALILLLASTTRAVPVNDQLLTIQNQNADGFTIHCDINLLSPDNLSSISYTENDAGLDIPVISRLIAVPAGYKVELEVSHLERNDLGDQSSFTQNDGSKVSRRPINHNELESILLDPPYTALAGDVGIFRGVPIAPINIFPIQFSRDGNMVVENNQVDVRVRFVPDENAPHVQPINDDPCSASSMLLDRLLLNPPHRDYDEIQREHRGRMLIIHPDLDSFNARGKPYLDSLITWKRQMGFRVDVEAIDLQEMIPNDIREMIREDYYLNTDDPISYLLIIGADSVQQELVFPAFNQAGFIGDHFYGLMEEDNEYEDLVTDIAVGRMHVYTYTELRNVIKRTILYERQPYVEDGVSWFTRAIYSAEAVVGAPGGDFVPSMLHLGYWIEMRLRHYGYTRIDQYYSRNENENVDVEVRDALIAGRSLAISRGWLAGCYDVNNNQPADTDRKNPFVMAVTCLSLERQSRFFRSARDNDYRGPIASFAISGLTHSKTNNSIIGGTVNAMIQHDIYETGWIQIAGKLQMYSDNVYAIFPYHTETMAVLRLLGDPTTNIFTGVPDEFVVNYTESITPNTTGINVEVLSNDEAAPDAWVCLWQPGGVHLVVQPGEDGWARFTIEAGDLEEGELGITVTRHNMIPYIGSIEVAEQNLMIDLADVEFDDQDGLFGNGESIPATLSLANSGNANAQNLMVVLSTEHPLISFSEDTLQVQNIQQGQAVDVDFTLLIDKNVRAADTVRIDVNVMNGQSQWQHAFDFITSGPNLDVVSIVVPDQNFYPGQTPRIIPRLRNRGDLGSPAVSATLVSDHDYIDIQQGAATFPRLNQNGSNDANGNLVVDINQFAIAGNTARFHLLLQGTGQDADFADTVFFEMQIGEAQQADPYGPDDYGYIAFDSYDEDWEKTPDYEWMEINPNKEGGLDGTRLYLQDDSAAFDWSEAVELPFEFWYYGQPFDTVAINSNGWIAFGAEQAIFPDFRNQQIPGIQGPDAQVAVFWQDFVNPIPDTRGVYYYYDQERGIFIVEWSELKVFLDGNEDNNANLFEFQVILYDPGRWPTLSGDGDIKIQYKSVFTIQGDPTDNYYFTIGLKNLDNTGGLQYSYWAVYPEACRPVENEMAILFTTDRVLSNGILEGRVTRFENQNVGLEEVEVYSQRSHLTTVTDVNGNFRFDILPAGDHSIEFRKPGYNTLVSEVNVVQNEVNRLDVSMTHPTLTVSDEQITTDLQPGNNATDIGFTISNDGNGNLEYSLNRRYADGSDTRYQQEWQFDVSGAVEDNYLYGCQFVGDLLYVTGGMDRQEIDDNMIYVVNSNHEVVRRFNQPSLSLSGFRDLAWDGEVLYGGEETDEGDTLQIVAFDTEGNIIRSFGVNLGPGDNLREPWALAWNPVDENLLVAYSSSDILTLDQDGNIIDRLSLNLPGEEFEIRGLAWNQFDNDQMQIYVMDVPANGGMRLVKADANTGAAKIVSRLENADRYTGSGLTIGHDWERSVTTLATIDQGYSRQYHDTLRVYEIGPDTHYLMVDPAGGIVAPGNSAPINLHFSAAGLAEAVYNCGLVVEHNAVNDAVLIPLTLTVTWDSYADNPNDGVPLEFRLGNAYPNPFNGTTRIGFTIAESGYANLTVYDLTGRQVAVLLNGQLTAGNHSALFSPDGLSSGIYFYKLISGEQSSTQRMVLLR